VSATSVTGQFFLWDHKHRPMCYTNCDTIFDHLSDYEKTLLFTTIQCNISYRK